MPIRQIGICSLVFILILTGSWLLNNYYAPQQHGFSPAANPGSFIVFSKKQEAYPKSHPFRPREYVHIVRKVMDISGPAPSLP